MKIGDQWFVPGDSSDPWVRMTVDGGHNYTKGFAAKEFWAQGKTWAAGRDILAELDGLRRDVDRSFKAGDRNILAELDGLRRDVDRSLKAGDRVSVCQFQNRGCLKAADGWDARTNGWVGDWERWNINRA